MAEAPAPAGATFPGLTTAEADRRLQTDGANRLPRGRRRTVPKLALDTLSEPLLLLLIGAALLYVAFGEPRDAILLAGSVGVIITLDIIQEYRAERTLEALEGLAQPTARVLRDGRLVPLVSEGLVRGDIVALEEGERVPADARLVSGAGILVDESLLTGESAPVSKHARPDEAAWQRPGGENLPFVYAGTLVTQGQGLAEVVATGTRTEMSRIAVALATVETGTPVLRRQTRGLVLAMGVLAVAGTAVVALVIGYRTGAWISGLLAGTALAIGLLPEEIPVVLTLYSILGARRMARHQALARRFGTIPTLGAVTVLLTDKTGTLTENRMTVVAAAFPPSEVTRWEPGHPPQGERIAELLAWAGLATESGSVDATERAVTEISDPLVRRRWPGALERTQHEPFTSRTRRVASRWRDPTGPTLWAAKGAPEPLLQEFGRDAAERAAWQQLVEQLSRDGLRVLAVAAATGETAPRLVGLLGLADPLRAGVRAAVAECHSAGIRVVMLTGDHPTTARAIARSAGLARPGTALVGTDLAPLTREGLARATAECDVYARVTPEEKLRLVQAFRDRGEVVAMTGDGVNDAPALRSADVGVAMGQRGTDVAREAASLVLLDDAFPTLVEAVRMGRRIHGNMRKAIGYLVIVHVALAGMALLPVLLGLPILLYPVEIVFLELIVDPTASLALEAEPADRELMREPPRLPTEPLVGSRALLASLLVGGTSLVASFGVYFAALQLGHGVDESRALSFAALVAANLASLHLHRSYSSGLLTALRSRNPVAPIVTVFGAGLLLASLYLPSFASVFGFVSPGPLDLGIAVLVGAVSVLWADPVKSWFDERRRAPAAAA